MRRLLVPLMLTAALLTACANGPDGKDTAGSATDFDVRADRVAAAWRGSAAAGTWKTGFIPAGELTIEPENGFPSGDAKAAFIDGLYTSEIKLPHTPSKGAITFPDGGRLDVAVVSAEAAYQQVDRGDPACATCGLTVTAAKLGTTSLRTSRGVATVPAWIFTVREVPAPIARVAVDPGAVTPIPEPSIDPYQTRGVVTAESLIKVSDKAIDYRLGVGSCDYDIRPLVKEYDDLIVIGGVVNTRDGICNAMLKLEPVTVTLAKPVGSRPIVEVGLGRPLWETPR